MNRTKLEAVACVLALFVSALALASGASAAQSRTLRLADRSVSVGTATIIPTSPHGTVLVERGVTLKNDGRRALQVAASDFGLSAQGDIVAPQGWDVGAARVSIAPKHARAFRLTFVLPSGAAQQAKLFYRPAGTAGAGVVPLDGLGNGPPRSSSPRSSAPSGFNTFFLPPGTYPWGTATDSAGNLWFAAPGCDFAPTCAASAAPGQIGEITASSHAIVWYTLPSIPGNQPIFLKLDGSGNLWFTTPNNSMIGEFSPSSGQFVGQWSVTAGSGPWDLTFVGGKIWYTEHLVSAVGRFDPATHIHKDFPTPSANSNPYGIAASGGLIWFTENNTSVDRIAALDTTNNKITEYPIVLPTSGTPHMIAIDRSGLPWWTEGWSNTIATLDPAVATPGQCGTTSGTCLGVQRFTVPPPSCSGSGTHTSGIAISGSTNLVWLDNSLTSQVGSFDPATGVFAMSTLSDCGAHPHDGLTVDGAGLVWFDEEFANAIGELDPGVPGPPPPPTTTTAPPPVSNPSGASGNANGSPAVPPGQAGTVSARQPTKVAALFVHHQVRVVRRRIWVHGRRRIVRVVRRDVVKTSVERMPYGAHTTVSGWLRTHDGVALRDQTVRILSAPDDGSSGFTYVAQTKTAANGTWTATLAPGPSRRLEAVYSGSATIAASSSPVVRVIVPAKIQLSVSPPRVPWGGEVLIRGRLLGGYVPAHKAVTSKLVRLRVETAGGHGTVEIPAVDRSGRFQARYCFNQGRGVMGSWLAVSTLSAAGYPFAPASSPRIKVTVGPAKAGRGCRSG